MVCYYYKSGFSEILMEQTKNVPLALEIRKLDEVHQFWNKCIKQKYQTFSVYSFYKFIFLCCLIINWISFDFGLFSDQFNWSLCLCLQDLWCLLHFALWKSSSFHGLHIPIVKTVFSHLFVSIWHVQMQHFTLLILIVRKKGAFEGHVYSIHQKKSP